MKSLAKQLQKLGKKTHMRNCRLGFGCGIPSMESIGVPRGCLPVYVGNEGHRFVVDIHYLSHPLFEEVLELSAEELGYSHKGGLRVACNINRVVRTSAEVSQFKESICLLSPNNGSAASISSVRRIMFNSVSMSFHGQTLVEF